MRAAHARAQRDGAGTDDGRRLVLPGNTCCLLGPSGVGKTTLINHLAGDVVLKTAGVSHTGEGRHTSARRQRVVLVPVCQEARSFPGCGLFI